MLKMLIKKIIHPSSKRYIWR